MIELSKVRGKILRGQHFNHITEDQMWVPDFLKAEQGSILPLDSTYAINNGKAFTELNVH